MRERLAVVMVAERDVESTATGEGHVDGWPEVFWTEKETDY